MARAFAPKGHKGAVINAVSTVGFEEERIRTYIQNQEQLEGQGSGDNGEF